MFPSQRQWRTRGGSCAVGEGGISGSVPKRQSLDTTDPLSEAMAMRRVLVTGCAGFIGSHLTQSLLRGGDEVTGIDCFNDNYDRRLKEVNLAQARDWQSFTFVEADLVRDDLTRFVSDADVVFHLAAEPGVRDSWGPRFK